MCKWNFIQNLAKCMQWLREFLKAQLIMRSVCFIHKFLNDFVGLKMAVCCDRNTQNDHWQPETWKWWERCARWWGATQTNKGNFRWVLCIIQLVSLDSPCGFEYGACIGQVHSTAIDWGAGARRSCQLRQARFRVWKLVEYFLTNVVTDDEMWTYGNNTKTEAQSLQ